MKSTFGLVLLAVTSAAAGCADAELCSDPLVFAYRGGRAMAPENTMAAFSQALSDQADGIEIDTRVTADGVLVAFHDDRTGRTSDDELDREMATLTYAELSELDVGSWFSPDFAGERVPTVAEAVAVIPAGTEIVFDLKVDAAVEPVAALIEAQGLAGRAYVSSFEIERLAAFHERLPEVRVGYCLRELGDLSRAGETEVDFIRLPGNVEGHSGAQNEVLGTGYGLVVTDAAPTRAAAMVVASDIVGARGELDALRPASCGR